MDKAFDRLDHAFAISERHLGIERLLDPEGIYSSTYIYICFCCACSILLHELFFR